MAVLPRETCGPLVQFHTFSWAVKRKEHTETIRSLAGTYIQSFWWDWYEMVVYLPGAILVATGWPSSNFEPHAIGINRHTDKIVLVFVLDFVHYLFHTFP